MGFQATKNVKVRQKNIGLRIKAIMIQRKITDDDVANGIDMQVSEFDKKINGLAEWKLSESNKLCNFLNVELSYIFLE